MISSSGYSDLTTLPKTTDLVAYNTFLQTSKLNLSLHLTIGSYCHALGDIYCFYLYRISSSFFDNKSLTFSFCKLPFHLPVELSFIVSWTINNHIPDPGHSYWFRVGMWPEWGQSVLQHNHFGCSNKGDVLSFWHMNPEVLESIFATSWRNPAWQ